MNMILYGRLFILQSAQRRIRTMVLAASAQASGARTQRGGAHRQEAPQ